MHIKEMFKVGEIMEWEDKAKSIKILDDDDCRIVSKALNKDKIILHMERKVDGSEGNVFVRLNEKFEDRMDVFKKLFASKKVIGISLNEFKQLDVEKI